MTDELRMDGEARASLFLIIEALEPYDEETRKRILETAAIFYGIET